jgi:hypothetical protein
MHFLDAKNSVMIESELSETECGGAASLEGSFSADLGRLDR